MPDLALTIWIVLFAGGALQGCVLAGTLLLTKPRGRSHGWLAALLLAVSFILASRAARLSGAYEVWPHLIWLDVPVWVLVGPLLFRYVQSVTGGGARPRPADLLHLIPFAARLADISRFYLLPAPVKLRFWSAFRAPTGADSLSPLGFIRTHLYFIQIFAYTVWSLRLLRRYENLVKESFSDSRVDRVAWLRALMTVFVAYASLDLGLSLAGTFGYAAPVSVGRAVILILSGLVHLTGVQAVRRPQALFAPLHPAGPAERTALDRTEADRLRERLERIMKADRPYLDSELSLSELAARLDVSPRLLSRLLNRELGVSFYDFVNRHRVEEAKKRLVDPSYERLSILGIASDVGFNSKPTFNRVFKKLTGETPSAYIRSATRRAT